MKAFPFFSAFRLLIVSTVVMACVSLAADEPGTMVPDPGYRPASDASATFLKSIGTASFDVLPTMIRRLERTAHSFESQERIVDFLDENQIGVAATRSVRVDQGILERRTQWDLFNRGIDAVATALANRQSGADYTLVMEILVPGDQSVFGIHVYILDQQGRNAFSFLLNAHHELFRDARLVAASTSEDARAKMIADATMTGLRALQAQIGNALECERRGPVTVRLAAAGILHDFESALPSGTDDDGVPIGYSTFAGPDSRVVYSLTQAYPPRENAASGNAVLRIDVDTNSWAGIIHRFTDNAIKNWLPQDWRDLQGLSFWFRGENSGAPVFIDVFDNRTDCSTTDDAERFRYRFMDDVAGWRRINVRFADLERWNVGNDAPDDGLDLTMAHGWGIGTSNAEGAVQATFYLDDFQLLTELRDDFLESPGLLDHGEITELRIDRSTSRIEVSTRDDGRLVVDRVVELMCACLRLAADRDFSYYRMDQREILNGDRARFRLTFYDTLPEDVPRLEIPEPPENAALAFDKSAAIPVDRMQLICRPTR